MFKIKVEGIDSFPEENVNFILAANHLSNLDPPLLGILLPRQMAFLGKEELFRNRLLGFVLKSIGVIPLKRGASDIRAMRTALQILKEKPLVVFPQGTRGGSYEKFTKGVGFLCKKTGVPVIAAKIKGTDSALPKGAVFIRRANIEVVFRIVADIEDSDSYEEIAAKVVATIKDI